MIIMVWSGQSLDHVVIHHDAVMVCEVKWGQISLIPHLWSPQASLSRHWSVSCSHRSELQLFRLSRCDTAQWGVQQAKKRIWRPSENDSGTGAGSFKYLVFTLEHFITEKKNQPVRFPAGPGSGLYGPDDTWGHQQPVDTWHAKPFHVHQTSKSVTGEIPGPGGWLEGRDRGKWREDEESDEGSI